MENLIQERLYYQSMLEEQELNWITEEMYIRKVSLVYNGREIQCCVSGDEVTKNEYWDTRRL